MRAPSHGFSGPRVLLEPSPMVSRCWFALVASLLLPVPGSDGGEATPQTPGKETKGSVGKPLLVKAWRGTSPGKDAKEYETRLVKHLAGLNAPPSVALDRFGGWMAEKHDATGFFYAKKIGKRWWLVDPEGHLFLHMAVNSVSPGKSPRRGGHCPSALARSKAGATARLGCSSSTASTAADPGRTTRCWDRDRSVWCIPPISTS